MNEEMLKDAVERSFNVSPETVYGVLVGLLLLGLIYALIMNRVKDRRIAQMDDQLLSGYKSTIEVLSSLDTTLKLFKQKSRDRNDFLLDKINTAHRHIIEEINELKSKINERNS